MRKFEIEAKGLGFNNSGYAGAFTPAVIEIIKSVISGNVLHLYSGMSLIGDERIDLSQPNATRNCRVEEFIKEDRRVWDWCVLDPPYAITSIKKLDQYAERASLSSNVVWRGQIKEYFQRHTRNILWLDFCAPMIKGFKRRKIWFLLPGGFHTVRVLSWLERETERLV